MRVVEKKPIATIALFSLILLLTAIALEFGFASIDPWRLPANPKLRFENNSFPSIVGVNFDCASTELVTKVDFAAKVATCSTFLTAEMAHCSNSEPLRGFADKIRCSKVEKAACESGGVQALGLFKSDVACANSTSETDLGPPAQRARSDDL